MFGFGKSSQVIGMDIGSSSIKIIELSQSEKDIEVTRVGIEPLAPEIVVDGAIVDTGQVSNSIAKLFNEHKIKAKNVATAVSGHSVIVKKLSLQPMPDEELDEAIPMEAAQHIPFDIAEVNLDYQVIDPGVAGGNMDILLVAAKKDKINDYMSVITQAGRNPAVMDIDAFALQNCYELNYGVEPDKVVALVNVGASQANINITRGDTSIFTRDITTIGGDHFTDAIQKDLSVSFEQADNMKQGQGGDQSASVAPIVSSVTETVLLEIQKTFDFFKATTSEDRIDRIVLSGGSSRISGLSDAMSERFDTRVELFGPFQSVTYNAKDFDAEFLEEVGPACTIAVGLALRKQGE